ncbi:hypothetical protein MMC11_008719 [Xylographa trunciseda]|nr:hypothetical protein [Xylographa trunciseda]
MGLGPRDLSSEVTTPTTPRAFLDNMNTSLSQPTQVREESAPTTPTRNSFVGASGKRALPTSPFSKTFSSPQHPSAQSQPAGLHREDSIRSAQSSGSQDVDMDDSDDGEDGSDGESIDGETGRPSKKKKGQRFFCTEFPPCNLSFTRSEHLARHIRKHTGERPFQCHCARRFSRLDNLRQHAQTVHVNEEIPGDSLAATGTRFQRQIRTDRVRPPGARSRASTAGSQVSHGRGHTRNLSASSVGSTASTISRDDSRRRPPPLMMAHDSSARARLTLDTMRAQGQVSTPPGSYTYANQSSAGPSTPTSTTYSNGPGSPYGSSIGSPISSVSRQIGIWGGQTPGRRLSVPSGANPFQSPHGHLQAPPYLSPLIPANMSNNSSNSSLFGSPTSSTYSFARSENPAAAEAEWRRRTWHPSTYSNYQRPATSGLSFYLTPDAPAPAFAQQPVAAVGQPQRLPGIETFDQMSQTPKAPPSQGATPTSTEVPTRPQIFQSSSERNIPGPNERRGHISWDMSLHQNLTKLDIANGTPPKEPGMWGKQVIAEMQNAASGYSQAPPSHQPPQPPAQPYVQPSIGTQSYTQPTTQSSALSLSQEVQKRPTESDHYSHPVTPNRSRRMGWYNGPLPTARQPVTTQRTSPEDSSSSEGVPTPSAITVEYQPSIIHANGYIETSRMNTGNPSSFVGYSSTNNRNSYPAPPEATRSVAIPKVTDMSGLEALVAVATSEEKATSTALR